MLVQEFAIRTRDGRTRLTGQVDLPVRRDDERHPAVLMVPGGWFMDRDGYMGGSGTERDLVYRDLAKEIVSAGIAVVRYDNRGVRCNEYTMPPCPPGSSEAEISRHYLEACVDADARQSVTVQTQMDDVEDVLTFAIHHPDIDAERMIVWAHSEGGLNVARLIGRKRICPLGVQFVGCMAESPAAVLWWQTVDRYACHVMSWDDDGDGRVTPADVNRCFPGDELFAAVGMSADMVAPPPEGWTLETVRDRFVAEYEKLKRAAWARPDDSPYPEPGGELRVVAASNNWWKQWFEDTTPLIDHLAEYRGYASFHLGEIDGHVSQQPGRRQLAFAQGRIAAGLFARPPRLFLHAGRGHSLRTGEPSAGPMDEAAKTCLLSEIQDMIAHGDL